MRSARQRLRAPMRRRTLPVTSPTPKSARAWSTERRHHFVPAAISPATGAPYRRQACAVCANPKAKGASPSGAPRAAISVPGAVLPGVGQGIYPFCRPAFAKPSSTPASSHSRQPVIVPADGDPRPPGAGVTSPGSRRRTHPASAVSCRTPLAWGRRKDYMTRKKRKSRGAVARVRSFWRTRCQIRGGGAQRNPWQDSRPVIVRCELSRASKDEAGEVFVCTTAVMAGIVPAIHAFES